MPAPVLSVCTGPESFHRLFLPGAFAADSSARAWFARHQAELQARGLVQWIGGALVTNDARRLRRACLEIACRPLPDGQNLSPTIRRLRVLAQNEEHARWQAASEGRSEPRPALPKFCFHCRAWRPRAGNWRGNKCPVCVDAAAEYMSSKRGCVDA